MRTLNHNQLPNLIIIGANKAGTTSLHEYLDQHPEIFMSDPKEPMFFAHSPSSKANKQCSRGCLPPQRDVVDTLEKYQKLFEQGGNHKIRGESSTAYLANPSCAKKIAGLLPAVKIVAVLRNPVDRAYSNYVMYKSWGGEHKSFAQAIEEELNDGRLNYPQGMRYLELGKYFCSLVEYRGVFGERVKIVLYDEFKNNPTKVIKDVFSFVEVDVNFEPNMTKKHNVNRVKRFACGGMIDRVCNSTRKIANGIGLHRIASEIEHFQFCRPDMSPDVRKQLVCYFNEEIERLQEFIGADLTRWKK